VGFRLPWHDLTGRAPPLIVLSRRAENADGAESGAPMKAFVR